MHCWDKKEKYILLMGKERKPNMNNLLVTKELLGRQEKVPAVLLLVKTMKIFVFHLSRLVFHESLDYVTL